MGSFLKLTWAWFLAGCLLASSQTAALALASVVVDVDSGTVLYQDNATMPWYPASTTKLMTVYVALSAVREGRITMDTPMMVSPRAAAMAPSKMGFRPGTLVTLDNALKMLMVKSPNDIAVTIAEGVSGSVEAFANDMNVYGTRLGLHESHFVNPNGLPDSRHVSSARDMAMIGRALLREFPEQRGLFGIGVLAFGNRLINNHNGLLGRYPGVDGMKTGFTCAAGYNVVASAERDGRHIITVIMGAPSTGSRNERAATLFDRFLPGGGGGIGQLDSLPGSPVTEPPDNHDIACGRGRSGAIAEAEAEDIAVPLPQGQPVAFLAALAGQPGPLAPASGSSLSPTRIAFEPVRVFVGPVAGWSGRVAQAVGMGARELSPAPGKRRFATERAVTAATEPGPVEAPAPAPMALLGATPVSPAALATKSFVRAAPGLGLAVGSVPRGRHPAKAVAAPPRPKLVAKAVEAPAPTAKPAAKTKLAKAAVVAPAATARKKPAVGSVPAK